MWFDRLGYDELRKKVKELDKKYKPDINLVEKKSTGITLIQDLRRASPGRVRAYSPGKGEDKISRAHSVSPMLQGGLVYIPNKVWALGNGKDQLGLIDYAALFPNGGPPSADVTDTITQALIYLRAANWTSDLDDDIEEVVDMSDYSEDDDDEESEERQFYT
jgi:phage terminase large subunit-like protein